MKLEEVLPAMRDGRVGIWAGNRYKIERDELLLLLPKASGWEPSSVPVSAMLDGWTLEPEPKVEWPKGSVQWACEESFKKGRRTVHYLRHRNAKGFLTADHIDVERVTEYLQACPTTLGSLGWEVVP